MGYLHPEISRIASPLQEFVPNSGPVGDWECEIDRPAYLSTVSDSIVSPLLALAFAYVTDPQGNIIELQTSGAKELSVS